MKVFLNGSSRRSFQLSRRLRLEGLESRQLLAVMPEMVVDLGLTAKSSSPYGFLDMGDVAYFTATDEAHGRELWKTDGTAAGTALVADLTPGPGWSYIQHFVALGDTGFFFTGSSNEMMRLWRTDGTPGGTTQVGPEFGLRQLAPEHVVAEGVLYFTAPAFPSGGMELWRTDGTGAGTRRVADINPSFFDSEFPHGLTVVEDEVFFSADDGTHGFELWKTDGTAEGTVLVKDVRPGGGDGATLNFAGPIATMNGVLYFVANDGVTGQNLWRSDGTQDGTYLVKDFEDPAPFSSYPSHLTAVGDKLFFLARDASGNPGLWKSDGTTAGTGRISDRIGTEFLAHEGLLYFSTGELWRSDGTPEGTFEVAEIMPGFGVSDVKGLTAVGDRLYFTADDGVHGRELWKSDGTAAGTSLAHEFAPGPASAFENPIFPTKLPTFGSRLIVTPDVPGIGNEPWMTDGTTAGTALIRDIYAENSGSYPSNLREAAGRLFFSAIAEPPVPTETWSLAQGSNVPTSFPTFPSVDLKNAVELNGDVYFASNGLWATNAAQQQLRFVKGFGLGQGPESLTHVNGTLYFTVRPDPFHPQLWKSDGTEAGTVLVSNLWEDTQYPFTVPLYLTAVGGTLFFVGHDDEHGYELWKSDGTAEGTGIVKDVNPGANGMITRPSILKYSSAAMGNVLYFLAFDGANGQALWRSDGTPGGTSLVKANVGNIYPHDAKLTVAGNRLYFNTKTSDEDGEELWVSDGTPAGTFRLGDLRPGPLGSAPENVTAAGNGAYFTADDGLHGRELWFTDGTSAGTRLVKDIAPGASNPTGLLYAGGSLYFAADDGVHGRELWRTDGTETGTWMVMDIRPGAASSEPKETTRSGNAIYFQANDGVHGAELWRIAGPAGDTNFDGLVDLTDLNNVRNHFGKSGNVPGDADGNGVVDLADLNAVRNHFGTSPVSPAPSAKPGKPIANASVKALLAADMGPLRDLLFTNAPATHETWLPLAPSKARRLKAIDHVFERV